MQNFALKDFGKKGVIRDIPATELPEGYLTRAVNVRVTQQGIVRHPSPRVLYTPTDANWMAVCERTVEGGASVFYGSSSDTASTLWVWDGEAFQDVSRDTDPYSVSAKWDLVDWGHGLLMYNEQDTPQFIDAGDTKFTDLLNWESTMPNAGTTTNILRRYKNFLVAMNIVENGIELPNSLIWSDAAYGNNVPPSWDYNDPATLGGSATRGTGEGNIVDGLELGDLFVIYCERGTHTMQFVGGSFIMEFRRLWDHGLINKRAVCQFNNFHFVVGRTSIYIHDGVTQQFPAEGRIEKSFYASLADPDSVRVCHNPFTREIWVYYTNSAENRCAWVWNYALGEWSFVNLRPNTLQLNYGLVQTDSVLWSDLETTKWSNLASRWSQLYGAPQGSTLYALQPTKISEMDYEIAAAEDAPTLQNCLIEKVGIALLEEGKGHDSVMYINRLYPHIAGTGVIRIRVGSSMEPNGAVTWGPFVDYRVGTDYKVDVRTTGRFLALQMRVANNEPGNWRITGMEVSMNKAGVR